MGERHVETACSTDGINMEEAVMALGVFLVAFLFAPVGMGGGMLFVPLFHYGADWPIDGVLIATSLILTTVVSYGSGLAHRANGHVHDPSIRSGLVGAVPGAILGVLVVVVLGSNLDAVFKTLSIAMLVWALLRTRTKMEQAPSDSSESVSSEPQRPVDHVGLRVGAGIGGMLSSVLGIGAGVVYVPMLQQKAHLATRASIGSSLHIMMVVVPIAVLTHLAFVSSGERGDFAEMLPLLGALMFLTYAGATMGAKVGMRYISPLNTMRVFFALVFIVLVRYVLDLGSSIV